MSKPALTAGAILAFAFAAVSPTTADAQSYVSTTAWRIPFSRIDSLKKLIKTTKAVEVEAKRRGGILDHMWLIHAWGNEYTAVEVTTWKSWAAIEDTTLDIGAAERKVYPDSLQRKRIDDGFNWVIEGLSHEDNIYRKAE
jgi:hypothetical protein